MEHNDAELKKMKPLLQNRWKVEKSSNQANLVYFGFRNYPKNYEQSILLSQEMTELISYFDGEKTLNEILNRLAFIKSRKEDMLNQVARLVHEGIVVDRENLMQSATLENYRICKRCVNNDYVLPGLEFNEEGLCAFCQVFDALDKNKKNYMLGGSTVDEKNLLAKIKSKESRFDVLVLYTGGKDSSFLLWYLAKKLKLRVLACTWNMPFLSQTARKNITSAYSRMPEVEFIERTVCWDHLQGALNKLVGKFGLPCICPFISYLLFYPVAVYEKIPLIMDGIEASQTYLTRATASLTALKIQSEMSDREASFTYLRNMIMSGKNTTLSYVDKFVSCFREQMPQVFDPLKRIVENSNQNELPLIKRLETDKMYCKWSDMVKILKSEIGWVPPPNQEGLLHTSCEVEKVKDFVQWQGFKKMKRLFYPMSMIEISLAVCYGHITRDEGFSELQERGYYGSPDALKIMMEKIGIKSYDIKNMHPDIQKIFNLGTDSSI